MDLLGNDISIDDIKSVPDDCEYALEAILAEYGQDGAPPPPAVPAAPSDAGETRPIRPEPEGDAETAAFSSVSEPVSAPPRPAKRRRNRKAQKPEAPTGPLPPEPDAAEAGAYNLSEIMAEAENAASPGSERSVKASETPEDEPAFVPFGEDAAEPPPAAEETPRPRSAAPKASGGIAPPILALLAAAAVRLRARAGGPARAAEEEDEGPELDADSASKYYAGHIRSLRTRTRLAAFLSVILAWIAFGLPVAGALNSVPAAAAVSLILELTVIVLGLDIFTEGLMSLVRGRPGLWSAVSLSCVAAALDAAVTAAAGGTVTGFPFCAVAALSMTFALSGALHASRGLRLSLRALALSRAPYAVTAQSGVTDAGDTLLKTRRPTAGYLHRAEEPDCAEETYAHLVPVLLAVILLLTVLAAAISGQWRYFFRILAAVTAPAAPFAAFLAFPLPYAIVTRSIFQSGAAIAGWPGLRDIGRSRSLVVTDRDLFPAGTLSIESIRILEGTWPEKVISCAGSVVCASGSGLAPLFTELMRKNGCSLQRVEDFTCSEGGGLTAMIAGEEVHCGSAGFMRLMSIRLPQKLASKSSVFVSINGVLAGIFTLKYVPLASVQDALVSLLHGRSDPVFAVRDFNITPLMLRQKFKIPTDGLDFPTYAKRFEISGAEAAPDTPVAAIISREGLGPMVEVSERGRKLYIAARLSTVLSVLCTLVGVLLMFTLCLSGAFDSASAGNVMTYMFLWLVPTLILAFGLGR